MKLTKAKLINATRDELIEMGYREVKDTVSGANGLFIKPIPEGFFLSLGLTISKFYDTRFTASLYLSKTTRWGSSWGDIPYESYRRVGRFLTKDERRLYLDDVHNAEGVSDAWWHFDSEGDIQKFIEVVKISERRFLEQNSIFFKIENSKDVKELVDYVESVFEIMNKPFDDKFDYHFLPKKKIDGIPVAWFKAAEKTLRIKNGILNVKTVEALAADEWVQNIIKGDANSEFKID